MTCYSPLHAFKAKAREPDKSVIVFSRPQSWRGERLDLPCGQCVGCRLERARQWAVRCVHEASLYDRNCFLTLTYDSTHLPMSNSLDKSHFPLFMKRLRKRYGAGIRYYHCGEYGEKVGRPHYHALLFNHDFEDKRFFAERDGNRTYTSEALSGLWPQGFSVLGSVTFESANYVARYVMKKITGKGASVHYGSRIPEYTTMSRRPGIGAGWYEKFKRDVFPSDRVIVRGVATRPPRFYDTLLARADRSTMELLKIKRASEAEHFVTDTLSDGTVLKVSDSCGERLQVKELCKLAEISTLKRPLEE